MDLNFRDWFGRKSKASYNRIGITDLHSKGHFEEENHCLIAE